MTLKRQIGWITLIFILSVLLRVPNLNRPLSKHHEFVTAISLRVLQVWEHEGAIEHNFSPAMNYGGEANKWIDNHATSLHQLHDEKGNFYYTSHPPFAYILPHAVFSVFQISATVLSLQVFHLAIHLLSSLLIFLIIKGFTSDRRLSILGLAIYTFLPTTLWFQSNTYMSDMLVHFFFLGGILIFLRVWKNPQKTSNYALLGLMSFFMMYTSWLAVFFGITVGVLSLFNWKKYGWRSILAILTGTSLGLILMYIQYSSIAGSDVYIDQLFQRFAARGSDSVEATHSFWAEKGKEVGILIFNYAVNYSPLLILGALFFIKGKSESTVDKKQFRVFAIMSLLPIYMLHSLLLNYSGHDFTTLYLSCFVAIGSVLLLAKFSSRVQLIFTAGIVVLGIGNYYFVNRPGEISQNGDHYAEFMEQGEFIREVASDDEVVFWLDGHIDPMTVVYAKRNIKEIPSPKEARHWLMTVESRKGVLIRKNAEGELTYSRIAH